MPEDLALCLAQFLWIESLGLDAGCALQFPQVWSLPRGVRILRAAVGDSLERHQFVRRLFPSRPVVLSLD